MEQTRARLVALLVWFAFAETWMLGTLSTVLANGHLTFACLLGDMMLGITLLAAVLAIIDEE